MLERLFPLSDNGHVRIRKCIAINALHHLSVMLPTVLLLLLAASMITGKLGCGQSSPLFLYWGSALLLLLAIYGIFSWAYRETYAGIHEESAAIRIRLAETIRQSPLSWIGSRDVSDLTSTLMEDAAILEHSLPTSVVELFGSLIACGVVLLTLFFFHPLMSASLFAFLPLSFVLVLLGHKIAGRFNQQNRQAKLRLSQGLQEFLDNIELIHSSPKGPDFRQTLEQRISKVVRTSMIYELVMGVFLSGSYNSLRVGLGTVVVTGGWLMARGELSLITYLTFLFVAARVYDPLTTIFFRIGEMSHALLSAERIRDLVEHPLQKGQADVDIDSHDILFDKVCFAYGDNQVIHDVSFEAKQGQVTALVGPSGSGKSTLTRLAARFWDVNQGSVRIGGKDVGNIEPETLLSHFSIVFQDVTLFNDSVYNNIRIGKTNATEEEVYAAARLAQCEEFIKTLPNGFETLIGENGRTLSGGQRQRLSIARAFLKDAPIILLDEATASLDPENETLIQTAINSLIRDKTVLVVAHRLRSVVNCDKIIVLDQGRVRESGTHQELLEAKGLYSRLFQLQHQSEQWTV